MADPSPHPFLRLAWERARAHPDVELAVPLGEGLALDVVPRVGPPFRLQLDALHLETLDADPAERLRALDDLLTRACHPADRPAWEEVAPRLRAIVRPGSTLLRGPQGPGVVARPLGHCLVEIVVDDHDGAATFVTLSSTEAWGLSEDGVRAAAYCNAKLDPAALIAWDPTVEARIWSIEPADGHPTGALCAGQWAALARSHLHGPPIVAAPHADLVLVAGGGDVSAVLRLAETAPREYEAGPKPVSPALYTLDDTGLVPLRVATDHPAFEALEASRVRAWADEVAAQAAAFGVPVQGVGVRQPNGRLATGVRADGPVSLLPEAEVYVDVDPPRGGRVPGSWPPWRQA